MRRAKWQQPQLPHRFCIAKGRYQSTVITNFRVGQSWTTSRVLLFSAFASSLTYVFGVADAGSLIEELLKKDKHFAYGSVKDLDKV